MSSSSSNVIRIPRIHNAGDTGKNGRENSSNVKHSVRVTRVVPQRGEMRERVHAERADGEMAQKRESVVQRPAPAKSSPPEQYTTVTPITRPAGQYQAEPTARQPTHHLAQQQEHPEDSTSDTTHQSSTHPSYPHRRDSLTTRNGSITGEAFTVTEPLPPSMSPTTRLDSPNSLSRMSSSFPPKKKQFASLLSKIRGGTSRIAWPFGSPHVPTAQSSPQPSRYSLDPTDDEPQDDEEPNNNSHAAPDMPSSPLTIASHDSSQRPKQPPIPHVPQEVTADYLNAVLHLPSPIESIRVEKPNVPGLLSVLLRVTVLEYADKSVAQNLPKSFIVKFSPYTESTAEMTQIVDLFRRECLAYAHLSAEQKDKTHFLPHLHYGHFDSNQRFILILEDCSNPLCGLLTDSTASFSKAVIIIQDLARFQAQFWHKISSSNARKYRWKGVLYGNDDEYLKSMSLSWLPETFSLIYHTHFFEKMDEFREEHKLYSWARYSQKNRSELCYRFYQSWKGLGVWINQVKSTLRLGRKYQFPRLFQEIDKFNVEEVFHMAITASNSSRAPRTIVHGNYHLENIVMRRNMMRICAIDWHYVSTGNGFLDLADFLVNSVSVEDNERYGAAFLKIYVNTLKENGVEISEHEEHSLWRSAIWYSALTVCSWSAHLNALVDAAGTMDKEKLLRPIENFLRLLKQYVYKIMLPLSVG